MASIPNPADAPPKRPFDVTRLGYGVLSYLVPGLGQIVDRRYAKGVLFFVCIYGLFFWGTWIGSASATDDVTGRKYTVNNVYLPSATPPGDPNPQHRFAEEGEKKGPGGFETLKHNLITRWQFVGQFWVGIAAWPAIAQYYSYDSVGHAKVERLYYDAHEKSHEAEKLIQKGATEEDESVTQLRRETQGYLDDARKEEQRLALPLVGSFQREPSQASLNAVHNAGDKRLELAWVFTVIAGVLNLLVIYDAVVGPAVPSTKKGS